MKASIKASLSKVKYVSCTADIWSRDLRSFIAVNAHWFDGENGTLCKALLACDRFKGSHTADAVASKLIGDWNCLLLI